MPVWEHLFDQQVLRACPRIQGSLRIVLSFLPGLVFWRALSPATSSGAVHSAPELEKVVRQAGQLPLG